MFAHNNEEIDYLKLAVTNAYLIKKNCGIHDITVVTKRSNTRLYKDTSHTSKPLPFYNVDRCDAYNMSPYDETILIDADYLILSDTLNSCWEHENEFMMNWSYEDIMSERNDNTLRRLSPTGITMYWATVVYFKKSNYARYPTTTSTTLIQNI